MQIPPIASRRPFTHVEHGTKRPDPYAWMRDTASEELVEHLRAERAWYEATTHHLNSFADRLRRDMEARIPAEQVSVRWGTTGNWYYMRHDSGSNYPCFLRKSRLRNADLTTKSVSNSLVGDEIDTPDEGVVIDCQALAGAADYFELGLVRISPDERLAAYSVDLVGDEVYTLRFRDIASGTDLADEVPRTYYGGAWSADSATFFYTVHDAAYRPYQVWRHTIGTPVASDVLVLEERDERFEFQLRGTRSGDLVVIWARSRDTNEVWVVDTHEPTFSARSVGGRRPGIEYHAEHLAAGNRLLIVTNEGAPEFRIMSAPVPADADQDHTSWTEVRPSDPAERVERVEAFDGHIVVRSRRDGHRHLRILPVDDLTGPGIELSPSFPTGTLDLGPNEIYRADEMLVCDQSYVDPPVWSLIDLRTGERSEVHRDEAPGHSSDRFVQETRFAPAPDGTSIPMTVIRRADVALDGSAPALVYAYGAYEYVFEPDWDPALPTLLDLGVVFVHAHVRGGGEGGRRWWLDGRMEHKQNTFTDLIACADALDGLVDGTRIATRGLSAGGLLQGAAFSQRPDRWAAVVAEVPAVDILNSMLDATIPLTVNEWDEWGDPSREADFRWMLAYSPYDNIPPAGSRPPLLVTGALHDPRVMVWEPTKWVAALRESDPEWSPRCVFRVETGAGSHAGPSGRLAHLAYEAEIYAWVLDAFGMAESEEDSRDDPGALASAT